MNSLTLYGFLDVEEQYQQEMEVHLAQVMLP